MGDRKLGLPGGLAGRREGKETSQEAMILACVAWAVVTAATILGTIWYYADGSALKAWIDQWRSNDPGLWR